VAVVGKACHFHFALDDEIDAGGGLVLIKDLLTLFVLQDGGARKVSERVLK
jgi:hypothetical protein